MYGACLHSMRHLRLYMWYVSIYMPYFLCHLFYVLYTVCIYVVCCLHATCFIYGSHLYLMFIQLLQHIQSTPQPDDGTWTQETTKAGTIFIQCTFAAGIQNVSVFFIFAHLCKLHFITAIDWLYISHTYISYFSYPVIINTSHFHLLNDWLMYITNF